MRRLSALVLLALVSCNSRDPNEPDWGVEMTFLVKDPYESPPRRARLEQAASVLHRKLSLHGYPYGKVRLVGEDQFRIRVPGVDAANLNKVSFLTSCEELDLHEIGGEAMQAEYRRSKKIPDGYRAIDNGRESLLIRQLPIMGRAMIVDAWPEGEGTCFRTREEPRLASVAGPLAIVMTGKVKQVTRLKQLPDRVLRIERTENPREMALILLSGAMELQLGRELKGKFEERRPESLEYFGHRP